MSRVDIIKTRISDMRRNIDETEERESLARAEMIGAKQRQLMNEAEVMALQNRIIIQKGYLERALNSLNESRSQFEENTMRIQESEHDRTRLQDREHEDDEFTNLELTAKQAHYENEEIENKYRESMAYESKLTASLAVVVNTIKTSTEKVELLEREAIEQGTTMIDVENKVNGYHEREDENQERTTSHNDQILRETTMYEEREAKIKTTERYIEKLSKDIKTCEDKTREVERQFEEIEQDM